MSMASNWISCRAKFHTCTTMATRGVGISVEVKGSLDFQEESSDDEVVDNTISDSGKVSPSGIERILQQQDEDEELEVFNIESQLPPTPQVAVLENPTPPAPPTATDERGRKLIDLMAASVAKHTGEKAASCTPSLETKVEFAAFTAGTKKPEIESSSKSAGSELGGIDNDSEAFGITYKPYNKRSSDSRSSYSITGVSGNDDDLRVDVAAKMENLGKKAGSSDEGASEEDDDAEFDIDMAVSSPESSLKIAQLVNKAAERRKEEESAILASLASEMGQEVDAETPQPEEAVVTSSPSAKRANSKDAKSYFDDGAITEGYDSISSMYQPGAAGDIEVRMELSEDAEGSKTADKENANTRVPDHNQADVRSVIVEEEDEEDEKDEDINTPTMGQISSDKRKELTSLSNAIEEFEAAMPMNIEANANSSSDGMMDSGQHFVAATYSDTLAYVQGLDLSAYEASINPFEPRKGAGKSIMTMMGLKADNCKVAPLKVTAEGWTTDDLLRWPFLVAQRDYDPTEPRQLLILQSIYRALMGKQDKALPQFVPATGAHWEAIGFQGNDPRTDINRAMKLFALLQALHFVVKYGREAKQAHYLSSLVPEHKDNDTGRDLSWPFMCVSISFTKEAIVALRTGELNSLCNDTNNVLDVLHAFHRACFDKFCAMLCEDPITHHAMHLSAIRTACADKPARFLKAYLEDPPSKQLQSASYAAKSEALGFTSSAGTNFEFVNVESQKEDSNGVDEAAAFDLSSNSKAKRFLV